MIPSVAFSLSGAVFGAGLGSIVLVGAIFLLARGPSAPGGMAQFGFAFLCAAAHYAALLVLPPGAGLTFLISEAAHGAFSMLLLAGSFAFSGKKVASRPFILGWAVLMVYCLAALALVDRPALRDLPSYVLAGAVMIWAGLLFLRQAWKVPGGGYGYVAALMLLWGLHKFDYYWLSQRAWLLPVGFALAQVLAIALAVAIILVAERTQRRFADQARAAVAASVERAEADASQLAAVLNNLADGVVTVDEAGRVQAFNHAAEQIFGRPAGEVLGRPASVLLPDPSLPERQGGLLAALLEDPNEQHGPREYRTTRADGTRLTLELSLSRVEAGGRWLCVGVLRDVSGRRWAATVDELVQEVNQRVLQGEGVDSLMNFLCRALIDLFDFRLAWMAGREVDGKVSIQGFAGPPVLEGYLRGLEMRWDEGPANASPAGQAIRYGQAQWTDPADPDAVPSPLAEQGIRQCLAVPVRAGQAVLGALTVGGDRPIDQADRMRLQALTARIGIALQVMNDQSRLRLQGAAMGAAANAIVITDAVGRIAWVNDAFTRLSGYSLDEAAGETLRLLRSGEQTDSFYHELWTTIQAGRVWRGELIERRKDGSLYTVEQTITPMRDRGGRINHFVAVHEDITERKKAEAQVRYLSSYDALTGLPNRGLFRQKLIQAIARGEATEQPLAVLFLDLDHFNRVNDTMGHELGDRLLRAIVDRLAICTRSADTLARVGGDEFAVILTEAAGSEAVAAQARRLLAAVTDPYEIEGHHIQVGGSVGVALYPEDAVDPDQLIKNADTAMYGAIREAPNGYRFFSNTMNEEMQARVGLERDLRRALSRDQFELHYQPQLEILTGRIIGLEALVRWNHPEQGQIMPGRFIPLAEESGLIVPLGDLVLDLACRQLRAWLDAGLAVVPVAVNLSAAQLRLPDLVENLRRLLATHAIEPRWIELELTESGIMEDAGAAVRTLYELAEAGIKLAIDDFGTGYSSLSYLKRFPVAKLKIDKSFVHSLGEPDGNDAAIARAIITLGHSLGMTVVSEGVETEEQLAYLRSQGCDAVQGYLFSRPLPAAQVPALFGPPHTEAAE